MRRPYWIKLVCEGPPLLRPGRFRGQHTTRLYWLWFALVIGYVDEHTYATTEYRWVSDE